MNFSDYVMIYVALFISAVTILFFNTDINERSETINEIYKTYLLSATEDAMSVSGTESSNVFENEDVRLNAIDCFYNTLYHCMNVEYSTTKESVKYYVPCIGIIDTNGFYINYNEEYQDNNGYTNYSNIITPIYTWSKTYGNYNVRYYLSDHIKVTNNSNGLILAEGSYEDVYTDLGSPFALNFLTDDNLFYSERNDIIISNVNSKIEYFINKHNNNSRNTHDTKYMFTMPKTKNEDWARILQGPTVMAFMQGVQLPYYNKYVNIYAMTGSELNQNETYYITYDSMTDTYYYHDKSCTAVTIDPQTAKYETMEECAKKGAYPCQECIR